MKKSRKQTRNICIFLSIISIILTIVFFVYLINLNMLPNKYLIMLGVIIGVIYVLLLLLIIPKKVKISLKITSTIILLLMSGILFYSGVVYVDKLIDFLDKIDNSIVQKETFYVLVLEDDRTKDINELLNKKIGYYNSASAKENNGKAFKMLDKKITYDKKGYENIEDLLNGLNDKEVSAILVNESVYSLIKTDLAYFRNKGKRVRYSSNIS